MLRPTRLARTLCGAATAALTLTLMPGPARAADGDLDPTFGNGGAAITDFATTDDYAYSVAVQPDGKIIAVGQSGIYPLFHAALVRYLPDGSLDATFGSGGKVTADLDAGGDQLIAVALQSDGKIVAAGALIHDNFQTAFLVARFLPGGSLDPTFGDHGKVITRLGDSSAAAHALVVQPDGKIVLAGVSGAGAYSELNDFALARYDADGSLDSTFGNGGRVITHFSGHDNTGSSATALALAPDGKLIVAGVYKNEGTPREFALARYRSDGSLDPTLGGHGTVVTSLGGADAAATSVALRGDGRIILAGYFESGHKNHDFALVRYHDDGNLDPSFGDRGRVISDLFGGSDDIASVVLLQRDGKLIVTGRSGLYPNFTFALARYQTNGVLDPSFGTGGKVQTSFGGFSAQSYGAALQRNGSIVLAGYTINASVDFVVARYRARMPSEVANEKNRELAAVEGGAGVLPPLLERLRSALRRFRGELAGRP
jgi:uncharacterized delta-60 repeat protein